MQITYLEEEVSWVDWGVGGSYNRSKLFPCRGSAALRQVNATHKKETLKFKALKKIFQRNFIAIIVLQRTARMSFHMFKVVFSIFVRRNLGSKIVGKPCQMSMQLKATALSVFFQLFVKTLRILCIRDLLIILRIRVSSYCTPSPAGEPFEFGSVCLCIHLPVTLFCQD